jgi:hypothetical protein
VVVQIAESRLDEERSHVVSSAASSHQVDRAVNVTNIGQFKGGGDSAESATWLKRTTSSRCP